MIDDKPTYVSADQLANLLKGMQGENVDKIEIIENNCFYKSDRC